MEDFIFGSLSTETLRLEKVRAWRSGITHLQHRTPRDPLPGQPVTLELSVGPTHPAGPVQVVWTVDGSDPDATHGTRTPLEPAGTEWDTLVWGYVRRFAGTLPGQPAGTVVRYRLQVGSTWADQGAFYAYYVDNDPTPDWAKTAVIYQIFVDRFYDAAPDFPRLAPKPGLHGNGTLRGIVEQLDYLAGLGVNCLWLTPVFPSPSYHGYDATSVFDINPRFGTLADYQALLNGAHARGMRVLMDFVPNHWSDRHSSFVDATTDAASPFRSWYTFSHWPDQYETFFGVKDLPQINLRYGPARQHVLDAARYWLELGVDGFRVDYCIGPTPDFYADFRRVTRAAKPDSWTFGEAIDLPDTQLAFEGGLDGALDFILLEGLRYAFAYGTWDARQLADFLDRHEAFFPASFSRPSFLDNHDMNRFLWIVQGDTRRLKLAALCQFTLAGAPIIYYGTEVGLSQVRDVRQSGWAIHEEARLPMVWGTQQDGDLLRYYQALCRLRTAHAALSHGQRQTVLAEGPLLVYRRTHGADTLDVVLNLSDQVVERDLDLPEVQVRLATDVVSQARRVGNQVQVTLAPLGGLVLGAA